LDSVVELAGGTFNRALVECADLLPGATRFRPLRNLIGCRADHRADASGRSLGSDGTQHNLHPLHTSERNCGGVLAYRLTARHDASVLAGAAFGFSPYRLAQLPPTDGTRQSLLGVSRGIEEIEHFSADATSI
jgi:hypothetical protein